MLKFKQLFINVALVVLAICVGVGTIMAVKADDFEYDCDISQHKHFYIDEDGDFFGDSSATSTFACSAPENYIANNLDCDDTNANIKPGVVEICDGVDNNCDGNINEGLATSTYFRDADGDGYGDASSTMDWCALPEGYVSRNQDCDDSNASTSPEVEEICDDGIDNNCNGEVDENCEEPTATTTTYYLDSDGDGYGNPTYSISSTTQSLGYVEDNTDCNDGYASINPGATEVCGDGIDNDCSGGDEVCIQTYYLDADGDGYGNPIYSVSSTTQPVGYVADNTDCDDSRVSVNPGANEVCGDDIDNNCNGEVDENCVDITSEDNDNLTGCHPCEGSFRNHGAFMSCLAHYTNCLKGIGEITGREKGQLMSANANKYKFEMKIKTQGNSNNSNNGKAKGKKK